MVKAKNSKAEQNVQPNMYWENKILQDELEMTQKALKEAKTKCLKYETVMVNTAHIPITVIAKDYGMGAVKFNKMLNGFGIQYKCGKTWCLYQKYAKKGYTHNCILVTPKGESKIQMYWTIQGQLFLQRFLKEKGILPQIQRKEDYK